MERQVDKSRRNIIFGVFCVLPLATAAVLTLTFATRNGHRVETPSGANLPFRPPSLNKIANDMRPFLEAAERATAVPRVIPSGGVEIVGKGLIRGQHPSSAYLHPSAVPADSISAATADADALATDNVAGLTVTNTVFATVTVTAQVPPAGVPASPSAVINKPAWVVTITSPQPVNMGACAATATGTPNCYLSPVTNNVLILDPVTGSVLAGFFM